jgi:flagellar biosynthetic protein FliR
MITTDLTVLVFDFLIVFVRIASMIMVLPGLSSNSIPAMAKIGISIALTTIVVPIVSDKVPSVPHSTIFLIVMIGGQIVVGLTIGWLVNAILFSLPIAGQIISYQIGLSSVLLPSNDLGAESTLISSILNLILPVLFFSSALLMIPVMAMINSFHAIPIDFLSQISGHNVLPAIMKQVVKAATFEFLIAVQIASPFLVIGLIWQAGLGLMARASPQLQIFFVAAPLQILAGLMMLALLLAPMLTTWQIDTSKILLHYMEF